MLMPQHRCSSCGQLVTGRCAFCRDRRDRSRPNAAQRGYCSERWRTFRACQLALQPFCVLCERNGRVTPANEVDHITPIDGPHDPKFLDFTAVQSLCHRCHSLKTAREDSTFARR